MKRFQFVNWFPEWKGFFYFRIPKEWGLSRIYDWFLGFGFWEIRKWHRVRDIYK